MMIESNGIKPLTRDIGLDTIANAQQCYRFGRIAQLGERCPYKAEVTGSIPVPPTRRTFDTILPKLLFI